VVGEILVAHLVGDYILQSHWMSQEKTKRWFPAIVHGLMYTLPFLLITQSPLALLTIAGTHAIIDRYRLAKQVVWLKNFIAPRGYNTPWRDSKATGYPDSEPRWLTVFLMIVADNTLHILINIGAILWL
jgi:hypothetical protein